MGEPTCFRQFIRSARQAEDFKWTRFMDLFYLFFYMAHRFLSAEV
jgi:hypothetical protein